MINNEKIPAKIGQVRILSENLYIIVDKPMLGLLRVYSFKDKKYYLWEEIFIEKDFVLMDP